MKYLFRQILKYYLKYLTKLALLIHRPVVIAIAGSTNKTFAKNEINKALRKQGINLRSNPKNFNTEIGLPLAILGLSSGYHEYKKWLPAIYKAPLAVLKRDFPEMLVLELGIGDPGDMKYLLSIIKPQVAVITDITQRYIDRFAGMDELAGEYEYLLTRVGPDGLLVLNHDNSRIRRMAENIKDGHRHIVFFGFDPGANWQAVAAESTKIGQTVKISHNRIVRKHSLSLYGEHHIYALLIRLIVEEYVSAKTNFKNR